MPLFSLDVLILAAGKGTRMKSELPKVLHLLEGKTLVEHVLDSLSSLKINSKVIVVGHGGSQVQKQLIAVDDKIKFVTQAKQLGTAHAVQCAHSKLKNKATHLLILAGDAPFIQKETLCKFIQKHQQEKADVSILTSLFSDPKGYGRIVRNIKKQVVAIREELDASSKEKRIKEINSGIYLFNKKALFTALKKVSSNNKKKEYYLTDTIQIMMDQQKRISAFNLALEDEVMGINSRTDLVMGYKNQNQKTIEKLLKQGVTVVSPENTFIAKDVKVGKDTVIYPFTYIESGVKIGKKCHVGPFARLREKTNISDLAQVGSYVEIVRSDIGKKTMVKHLSYIGDASIGNNVNIGAGTITANYDGKKKHKTQVQDGAFIGSNTVLVSPVKVGKGAKTGAGSVVLKNRDIPKGAVAFGVPAKNFKNSKRNKGK